MLTPTELAEKLAAIVPPPHANQTLYHGVLAAHAAWRAEVIPKATPTAEPRRPKLTQACIEPPSASLGWADLLLRVFHDDAFLCPTCSKPMRIRSVVTDPRAARRILAGLTRARAPPLPSPGGEDRVAQS